MGRARFWGRTRALAQEIDDFLDAVLEGALVFQQGIDKFLAADEVDFLRRVEQLVELEHRGDTLKRDIQTQLYTEMLLPDSRSDVLHLIRQLDEVLDLLKRRLHILEITRPDLPEWMHERYRELVAASVKSIEALVNASRSYFRDIEHVRDFAQQASFFESESDAVETRLLQAIYGSELPLDQKQALRENVEVIGYIAHVAEDVADHLLIYAIKRSL